MTPKEKAQELVNKYLNMEFGIISEYMPKPLDIVIQCALIAVDELIKEENYRDGNGQYWESVKQEIEKL